MLGAPLAREDRLSRQMMGRALMLPPELYNLLAFGEREDVATTFIGPYAIADNPPTTPPATALWGSINSVFRTTSHCRGIFILISGAGNNGLVGFLSLLVSVDHFRLPLNFRPRNECSLSQQKSAIEWRIKCSQLKQKWCFVDKIIGVDEFWLVSNGERLVTGEIGRLSNSEHMEILRTVSWGVRL